jgi:hypothetical protein
LIFDVGGFSRPLDQSAQFTTQITIHSGSNFDLEATSDAVFRGSSTDQDLSLKTDSQAVGILVYQTSRLVCDNLIEYSGTKTSRPFGAQCRSLLPRFPSLTITLFSTLPSLSELCFQCDEWITAEAGWHNHCQRHLDDLASLPAQYRVLTFQGTITDPGRDPFCMFDSKLPPPKRMHQFFNVTKWRDHVHNHVRALERKNSVRQSGTSASQVLIPTTGVPYSSARFATWSFICWTSTASPGTRTTL